MVIRKILIYCKVFRTEIWKEQGFNSVLALIG